MTEPVNNPKLNRRSLFLGAIFLVGGAVALTRYTKSNKGSASDGASLSFEQYSLVERISEIMIPQTDTPGAIAAGVPEFVRDMYARWASVESRAEIASVLDAIEKFAWASHGAGLIELAADKRIAVLREFDQRNVNAADVPYRKFKHLILTGYYHSEIGATQELRFELVPGAWRPCMPLSEVGRSSAV